MKESSSPWPDTSSASGSCSSQEADISQPGFLTISSVPSSRGQVRSGPCLAHPVSGSLLSIAPYLSSSSPVNNLKWYKDEQRSPESFCKPALPQHKLYSHNTDPSFVTHLLDRPKPLLDLDSCDDNLDGYGPPHPKPGLNIPVQPRLPAPVAPPFSTAMGPAAQWILARREEVVRQMTEACLNQSLDALLARDLLMREDYELVSHRITRTAKVRQLLDTCDSQSEDFCRVIIHKLQENKQMGLQPYPEISSPTPPRPSAPTMPSCFSTRNVF